jgi:hypothetical protein
MTWLIIKAYYYYYYCKYRAFVRNFTVIGPSLILAQENIVRDSDIANKYVTRFSSGIWLIDGWR